MPPRPPDGSYLLRKTTAGGSAESARRVRSAASRPSSSPPSGGGVGHGNDRRPSPQGRWPAQGGADGRRQGAVGGQARARRGATAAQTGGDEPVPRDRKAVVCIVRGGIGIGGRGTRARENSGRERRTMATAMARRDNTRG
eukprot:TRINITY_DN1130_c0_g1_i2.p3 TRINITY_DN1130_c0_g1~~TRINITY_DN1130_c0_g1_i2.p3  ORF type:complete len:141 (+),score=4.46 TRINITY_DN1130_c0_g1_i2:696-1118(+)